MTSQPKYCGRLNIDSISPNILKAQYAVRGDIVIRANEIAQILASNNHENKKQFSFSKVIKCNIGNPQALGQRPLTYARQVLSLLMNPELTLKNNNIYPNDVILRAKLILNSTADESIGAYTHSQGMLFVRETVSKFIQKRDSLANNLLNLNNIKLYNKYKSNPNHIFLTGGASVGISRILKCLINNPLDGVLIPIPQYPLYTATIALLNGTPISYELNEEQHWGIDFKKLKESIVNTHLSNGKSVSARCIVVINPSNPTGHCLKEELIISIIKVAYEYNLVILADEVYQENVYNKNDTPFISFKKCLCDLKYDKNNKLNQLIGNSVQLASFHSVSKGIYGECGLRGGYFELVNVPESAIYQIYKLTSIGLCCNTIGQSMVQLMCDPPKKGDESYELFKKEYNLRFTELDTNASIVSRELNKINGITCNKITGSMYAFPQMHLPKNVVSNVRRKNPGKKVDFVYCMELLESKGICVVPGSGFGQKDGTFHLRTTILPPKNEIENVVKSMSDFHKSFLQRYSQPNLVSKL